MAIFTPKISFSGVISVCYQPQTLRNNAQTIRKLYCALLRDIQETILEIVKILSVYLSNYIHFA